MLGRWQRYGLMLVVTILTLASVATLVHRHVGNNDDQGCVLCHVRHEPGIENPVENTLAAPVTVEWKLEIAEVQSVSHDSVSVRSGRAPPASSLSR